VHKVKAVEKQVEIAMGNSRATQDEKAAKRYGKRYGIDCVGKVERQLIDDTAVITAASMLMMLESIVLNH
jgi:hypothetical protein